MFAAVHSDIHSRRYGLLHLTGQPNSQKGRASKVKDGIILETKSLVDRYNICHFKANFKMFFNVHSCTV
jgi:hypothetical protein